LFIVDGVIVGTIDLLQAFNCLFSYL